ncbi:inner membrane-spanning protein YciB [Sphingomonas sp.]|uniref:inner membrane-spanning protein YciB n=1 Tax=Sphingomonas sp. TaxID=28214 RepID=UPI003AFFCDAD
MKPEPSPTLRMAIDFGPLVLFFLANFVAPVPASEKAFVATGVFMAATAVAMLVSRWKLGAVSPMLWLSGVMVLVFGGLTLAFHDEDIIRVKPTIYYLTVSGGLFAGLMRGKALLKLMFGSAYPGLSERGWLTASRNWALFFLGMAIANEVAWRHMSFAAWSGFKLWGAMPATVLFALANVPMMMRHGLMETPGEAVAQHPPGE